MMRCTIVLLLTAFLLNVNAQFPRVDIPGSEVRKITSSLVAGQEYELHILFPDGKQASGSFMLDCNDVVFLFSGIPHALLNTGKEQSEYFAFQWRN